MNYFIAAIYSFFNFSIRFIKAVFMLQYFKRDIPMMVYYFFFSYPVESWHNVIGFSFYVLFLFLPPLKHFEQNLHLSAFHKLLLQAKEKVNLLYLPQKSLLLKAPVPALLYVRPVQFY